MRDRWDQAQLRLTESPHLIVTPSLVVLLGSTPALAGLELMRHMLELQPNDLRRVAFVHIDTDDPPNTVVEFRRQHSGSFQEFPLRVAVPAGINRSSKVKQTILTWDDSNKQIIEDEDDTEQHTFIQEKRPQYFANGAGGIRNNGHVAACFNYQLISNTLDAALSTITRMEGPQEYRRVHSVQANLVAFLGGGTGSGMVVDIAVMVRELFISRQFKQRINLFCILPEPIRGISMSDFKWRESNTTAGLLELLAYSQTAAGDSNGYYKKYMRNREHVLTNDPIANEVYLVGHTAMADPFDSARLVGIDLFQRITDASGVGFLEQSRWVDRRTLGENDDRGLPTMFGTSCPLEVYFPAQETATAFAHISSARLLPLIASFIQRQVNLNETEKSNALHKWRNAIRIEASGNGPLVVHFREFRKSEFEHIINTVQLDSLWSILVHQQQAIEQKIKEITDKHYDEQMQLISNKDSQRDTNYLLFNYIQFLLHLQQEYKLALENLKENEVKVPDRPIDQERKLIKPDLLAKFMRTNNADVVCTAYNVILHAYANATRYRLLEALLKNLLLVVKEALNSSLSWLRGSEVDDLVRKLETIGNESMAWRGRLDHQHPHLRHLFDLRSLRKLDGRSVATERLYNWVTGGDKAVEVDISTLDFTEYVAKYIEYTNRSTVSIGTQKLDNLEGQTMWVLAKHIEEFFRQYYMQKFKTMNLFELLEKATPPPHKGQSHSQLISTYMLEHLKHLRGLVSGLVAFETELWHDEGLSTLDTSVYLGINFRDDAQKVAFGRVLDELDPITNRRQTPLIESAFDPHRLQVSYGQHAISLSTVRDFCLDQNSSMEAYLANQEVWEQTGGKGNTPVHSSGQAQFLVCNEFALGNDKSLAERVIRETSSRKRGGM